MVTSGVAAAAGSSGGSAAQLQLLAMCMYLVLPKQPEVLSTMGKSLRWTNFQLEWPSSTNADGVCEPSGITYEHPYIPESYVDFAHASFGNVWCLTFLIHAVLLAVQKALHSLGRPVPAMLQAPQAQFFLVSLATPSLMQSTGFVLAHGGLSIYTFLAVVSLAMFLVGCLCLAYIIRQGLVVNKICEFDEVGAKAKMLRSSWVPQGDLGSMYFRLWGNMFRPLRGPRGGEGNLRLYYFPLRLLSKGLQGFLLGIFVRCVPHCGDGGPPRGSSASQITLLILLTGAQAVSMVKVRPMQDMRRHVLLSLAAWCNFLTFVFAAVLAAGVSEAVYAMIAMQLLNLVVQLLWAFFTLTSALYMKARRLDGDEAVEDLTLADALLDMGVASWPTRKATRNVKDSESEGPSKVVMNPLIELSNAMAKRRAWGRETHVRTLSSWDSESSYVMGGAKDSFLANFSTNTRESFLENCSADTKADCDTNQEVEEEEVRAAMRAQ